MIKTQVMINVKPRFSQPKGKILGFLLFLVSSLLFSKTKELDIYSFGSGIIIDETQAHNETIYVTEKSLVHNFSDKSNLSITEIIKRDAPEQKSIPNAKKNKKVEVGNTSKLNKKQSIPKKICNSEINSQEKDSFLQLENAKSFAVAGINFHIKFTSTINDVNRYLGILCFSKLKINNFVLTPNSKNIHRLFSIRPPPYSFV
jgi:hypothetical protein